MRRFNPYDYDRDKITSFGDSFLKLIDECAFGTNYDGLDSYMFSKSEMSQGQANLSMYLIMYTAGYFLKICDIIGINNPEIFYKLNLLCRRRKVLLQTISGAQFIGSINYNQIPEYYSFKTIYPFNHDNFIREAEDILISYYSNKSPHITDNWEENSFHNASYSYKDVVKKQIYTMSKYRNIVYEIDLFDHYQNRIKMRSRIGDILNRRNLL